MALTWLANALLGQGVHLRAGDIVSTGTCLGIAPLQGVGDAVRAEWDGFGAAHLRAT